MPFKRLLTELLEAVPAATGAILADGEGEAVVQCCRSLDDYHLKVLAAHMGIVLDRLREAAQRTASATSCEAVITTVDSKVMVGTVGDDYFLLLALTRDAVSGDIRRHFTRIRDVLIKEIC